MDIFNTNSLKHQITKHNNFQHELSQVSSQLIYQTLLLRKNLKYWTAIRYSLGYKIYYGLQILPFKLVNIWHHYRATGEIIIPNLWQVIHDDIKHNIKLIRGELSKNYTMLGSLQEQPQDSQIDINDSSNNDPINIEIKDFEPPWYVKYWLPLTLLIFFGPIVSFKLNKNKFRIINWINENLVGISKGFVENWVITPLKQCVNIIKQDDNIIMSKEALNSDISSLERMITDYLVDAKVDLPDNLHDQIVSGDLTSIMSKYELELKSPISNLIKGNLVRSLLIQLQKTKVDGDIVISGIDKLIKSQQLLLAIVSVSPSLVICYVLYQYLTKPNFIYNGKDLKLSCLNNLINLKVGDDDESKGELMVNIINLKIESKLILNRGIFEMFKKDLDDLINGNDQDLVKLYTVYTSYFK